MMRSNMASWSLLAALVTTFASVSARADDGRPWFECKVPSKSGAHLMKITLEPTRARGGDPAYQLTSDQHDPNVSLQDDPLIYEFVFNQTAISNTKDAFEANFHFMFGFLSDDPGNWQIKINKATGEGEFHKKILQWRHVTKPNDYSTMDLKLTGCKQIANPYAAEEAAAAKHSESTQTDAAQGDVKDVAQTDAASAPSANRAPAVIPVK